MSKTPRLSLVQREEFAATHEEDTEPTDSSQHWKPSRRHRIDIPIEALPAFFPSETLGLGVLLQDPEALLGVLVLQLEPRLQGLGVVRAGNKVRVKEGEVFLEVGEKVELRGNA